MQNPNMQPHIPEWLDDAGLSPEAFRAMLHIYANADERGVFATATQNIRAATNIPAAELNAALAELVGKGWIRISGGDRCTIQILALDGPPATEAKQ